MSLKPLYIWLIALNGMSLLPYTYGPLSFVCLLISVFVLWRMIPNTFTLAATTQNTPTALSILAYSMMGITIASSITGLVYQPQWLVNLGGIIDIAANTYAATDAFAQGLNPYTTRSQLWVEQFPADTPHMDIINGQITMYGIPYFHGYPYFPLMLLSYLPAYFIFDGYTAIRVTHIVLMLLNIAAFKLLLDKLLPDNAQRRTALLIAITAYLGVLRYSVEAVLLGVTDMLISTYLLYGFVALSYQRYFIAGLLLGCAQACKLLPAPFVFLGITWLLYNRRESIGGLLPMWRFWAGFVLACCVFILPFIIWHWQGFLSSTILYYLTHHQEGDFTSLWSFLPAWLQTPFLLGGLVITLVAIISFAKRGNHQLIACIAGSYASYVIFMSFSKMTHLNYLWGVFPLGCVVLAIAILPTAERQILIKQ
jgi:hypothetical protein